MKKSSKINKLVIYGVLSYVMAIAFGIAVTGIFNGPGSGPFGALWSILLEVALLILLAVFIALTIITIQKRFRESEKNNKWFRSVLDAIVFPVHVTDNDMKWTFMNKAFEKLMTDQNVVRNRESGYGMDCCNAGANICQTENCGIKQLRKGVGESYFDWCGMHCKQDTSYLVNDEGDRIGFVEVVTDLTALIRVNTYNAQELSRIVSNLNKMAVGETDLDLDIEKADEHTKESYEQFRKIAESLDQVKQAINSMIDDADMLTNAAVNGLITTRADASKHKGGYRKVVEGVNATLDTMVKPIDETIIMLNKISNNDLDVAMSTDYKGSFKELAESINNVVKRLLSVEDAFYKVSIGDTSRLEEFKKVGKRSANDRLMPSAIAMMQNVRDVIVESNRLANACIEGNLEVRGNSDQFEG